MLDWVLSQIKPKEVGPHMRKAVLPIIVIACLLFVAGWKASSAWWNRYVQQADRDRDYYKNQITKEPFRRQVENLCRDLNQFANLWETKGTTNEQGFVMLPSGMIATVAWRAQFEDRVKRVRVELVELGIHSDFLDQATLYGANSPKDVRAISDELLRLSKELPEDKR
jgi:hypothetical protein